MKVSIHPKVSEHQIYLVILLTIYKGTQAEAGLAKAHLSSTEILAFESTENGNCIAALRRILEHLSSAPLVSLGRT